MKTAETLIDGAGPLAILAFGAHPDDTDIGCAGTLAKHALAGHRVGVCDLTYAEMSSNGTIVTRGEEAKSAGLALGLHMRMRLPFPDRGLSCAPEIIAGVVDVIRRFKPTCVFAPDWEDRHPDHRRCAEIVEEAVFSAGLSRFQSPSGLTPHRVKQVLYYAINGMPKVDLAVDISTAMDRKKASLSAYGTQFFQRQGEVATPLNQGFLEAILGRDALVGHQCGLRYAEGFRTKKPLTVDLLVE